jgi:hypothetical protein
VAPHAQHHPQNHLYQIDGQPITLAFVACIADPLDMHQIEGVPF